MNIVMLSLLIVGIQVPKDATVVDLGDGYAKVTTASYSIEVPKGWEVSAETPWGQRKAQPVQGGGELGVMTAPPGRQTWEQLYETSLYFILRESKGEATPYRLSKTKSGLEAATFEVLDGDGFASRRYVLIRDEANGLLALSVSVPSRKADKLWSKHFKRLIETAQFTK